MRNRLKMVSKRLGDAMDERVTVHCAMALDEVKQSVGIRLKAGTNDFQQKTMNLGHRAYW